MTPQRGVFEAIARLLGKLLVLPKPSVIEVRQYNLADYLGTSNASQGLVGGGRVWKNAGGAQLEGSARDKQAVVGRYSFEPISVIETECWIGYVHECGQLQAC